MIAKQRRGRMQKKRRSTSAAGRETSCSALEKKRGKQHLHRPPEEIGVTKGGGMSTNLMPTPGLKKEGSGRTATTEFVVPEGTKGEKGTWASTHRLRPEDSPEAFDLSHAVEGRIGHQKFVRLNSELFSLCGKEDVRAAYDGGKGVTSKGCRRRRPLRLRKRRGVKPTNWSPGWS